MTDVLSHGTPIFNHRTMKRKRNRTINVFLTAGLYSTACSMTQSQARKQPQCRQCAHHCPHVHLTCRLLLKPADSHSNIFAIYRYTPRISLVSFPFIHLFHFSSSSPSSLCTEHIAGGLKADYIESGVGEGRQREGGALQSTNSASQISLLLLPPPPSVAK
jgi:hypothetical protein